MNSMHLVASITATCLAAALPGFCQSASDPQAAARTGFTGSEVLVVRDPSHPAWRAMDAQYAKIAKAVRKQDYDSLFALYTPDFQVKVHSGEIWGRDKTLNYLRNGLAQAKETIHTSNTILQLTIRGDNKATATVLQQWYRMQMVSGKLRRIETNGVQDEHWVKTPEGWKRKYLEEIRAGAAFVDGKRVDPTKSLDPEAPPYDPYDPHPRQPVADALLATITEKGIEAALREYSSLKRRSDAYYVSEASLNGLGYRLLGIKKIPEAITIFRLNAETYPRSANVYDSLAEAYLAGCDREQAIRNYQRSLALNPQNGNARDQLKRLREAGDKSRP